MTVDITHIETYGGPPYLPYNLIPGYLIPGYLIYVHGFDPDKGAFVLYCRARERTHIRFLEIGNEF